MASVGAVPLDVEAVGRVVRAVSVVSARLGPSLHAATVDSLSVVSHDPARVVVAVRDDSRWWQLASETERFAVSVLATGQEDLARWFASRHRGRDQEQLAGVGWRAGARSRAPLLDGAAVWFECGLEGATRAGHQVIVVARVAGETGHDPARSVLLRVGGRYTTVD